MINLNDFNPNVGELDRLQQIKLMSLCRSALVKKKNIKWVITDNKIHFEVKK